MILYASKFELVMNLRPGNYTTVDFGDGRTGLYLKDFRNQFKTPLAATGTSEEIEALIQQYVKE